MTAQRPIAFFDFDGTLTKGDSLIPFLRMVRGTPRFAMSLLASSPWLGAYAIGLMRNDRAKKALLRQTLAGMPLDELREYGRRFAGEFIPALLRPDTMARLRQHQADGHICVLVSASLDIYLEPWALDNGFEHWLVSSLHAEANGLVNGNLSGSNCFGEEKVRRIQGLLDDIGASSRTYAYGDSQGDIPMLKVVDEGYLVNKTIQLFTGHSTRKCS